MFYIFHNNTKILFTPYSLSEVNYRVDGNGKYWILKSNGDDNIHLALDLKTIDETASNENRTKCRDIHLTRGKQDDNDVEKWSINGNDNPEEVDGWEERII